MYMSPEILVEGEGNFQASISELMLSDIWSLGMTLFTMINPSLKCPFLLEIRSAPEKIHSQEAVSKFVSNLVRDKKLPLPDVQYNIRRVTVWSSLEEVYVGCAVFDPAKRLFLSEIELILSGKYSFSKICDQVKLKVNQSTAAELNDHRVACKLQGSEENHNQLPEQANGVSNDGTNAWAFLSVNIADRIIHELDDSFPDITTIAETIEEVIWSLPEHVNTKRGMQGFTT